MLISAQKKVTFWMKTEKKCFWRIHLKTGEQKEKERQKKICYCLELNPGPLLVRRGTTFCAKGANVIWDKPRAVSEWTKSFNSVALIFHPFIIPFLSSVAHSHLKFYVCSHHLLLGAFIRVKLNFIREVVILILVAQSLHLLQHSMTYLLRDKPSAGSFFLVWSNSLLVIGNMSWLPYWFHESHHPWLLPATSPLALQNEPCMGLPCI